MGSFSFEFVLPATFSGLFRHFLEVEMAKLSLKKLWEVYSQLFFSTFSFCGIGLVDVTLFHLCEMKKDVCFKTDSKILVVFKFPSYF